MSLKIWLLLNNNINNQGLTDWTPTIQSGTATTLDNQGTLFTYEVVEG